MADDSQLPLLRRASVRRALVFFLGVLVAGQLTLLAFDIPMAFDISFPEGAVVYRSYEVARGNSAYTDWRVWPHGFAPYAPLTYYPVGWFARIFLGPDVDPLSIYTVGRLQSAICFLGTLVLFGGILRRLGAGWAWSLPAIAAFLSWRIQVETTLSFRPDAPQVFFSVMALWVVVGGPPTRIRILASLAALMASMWYKPMSWGVLLAVAYWIAGTRGWRQAGLVVVMFGAVGLATALVVDRLVGGTLLLNMLAMGAAGIDASQILKLRGHMGWAESGFFAAGYAAGWAGLLVTRARHKDAPDPAAPFFLALVLSLPIALVQSLKVGSSANYLLESYALASVALGWGMAKIWPGGGGGSAFRKRVAPALVAVALLFFASAAAYQLIDLRDELDARRRLWEPSPIAGLLESTPGLILSMTPYYALVGPSEPTILDYVQYTILREFNERGDADLIERVERREFSVILLPQSANWVYSRQFIPALREHYIARDQFGPYLVVYRPRTDGD